MLITSAFKNARTLNPLTAFIKGDLTILPAINRDEIRKTFGIRHAVFCKEKGFEQENKEKIETDDHDSFSTQLLLSMNGTPIGCSRFVHGYMDGHFHELPMEQYGHGKIDKHLMNIFKNDGQRYAEISRLAIHPDFRGNKENKVKPLGVFAANVPLLQLVLGMKAYAHLSDTTYLTAVVEERLRKCLNRIGVPTHYLGEPIEHRGIRHPILIVRDEIKLSKMLAPFYPRVYKSMKEHLAKVGTMTPTSGKMDFDPVEFTHIRHSL